MKISHDELSSLITSVILNQVPTAQPVPDSPLIGSGRIVDSIGLVTLLVSVEEQLASQYGWSVSLMDDRAMSQTRSPFRTIGTLAEYLSQILNQNHDVA